MAARLLDLALDFNGGFLHLPNALRIETRPKRVFVHPSLCFVDKTSNIFVCFVMVKNSTSTSRL